jgi:AcrR family transcriptional regulator
VVEAAQSLFLTRGYATTTMEAISEAAQTPAATLYRLFGSKVGVLAALLDTMAVGDDEPIPLGDRPHVRALLADPDPARQLHGFAGLAREVVGRLAPIQRILLGAADADPAAAALLAEHTRQRREGQARIAHTLAIAGALRTDLTEADAADIIYTLMSPEVYRLLTADRGWSPHRYESWLGSTLTTQLLPPPTHSTKEQDPSPSDPTQCRADGGGIGGTLSG